MIYLCCDKNRRLLLREENERRASEGLDLLNGVDFLEVLDADAPEGTGGIARQNTLLVRLFQPAPLLDLNNVSIEGGERIAPVSVVWAFPAGGIPAAAAPQAERDFFAGLPEADRTLVVRTDSTGDYSFYRLVLIAGPGDPVPPEGFDRLFAAVDFSFKVECPSDFDCAPRPRCPLPSESLPPIDYLAKDYRSFRRLMLDRISQLIPGWSEGNAADLGVTLVELLAYAADRLSYRQDATATEAHLETARRRVSVRRHARLVDYLMHDGCNARTWLQVEVLEGTSGATVPLGTAVLSRVTSAPGKLAPDSLELDDAMRRGPLVFETMEAGTLFFEHGTMPLYTWGDGRCCLPKGATRATLHGHFPNLQPGNVVIFSEVKGPVTGDAADADPTRRHAVRLTEVRATEGGSPLADPLTGEEVTEVVWGSADALPLPFCVSSITGPEHGEQAVTGVTEVWGNLVLADHGETIRDEELGTAPEASLFRFPLGGDRCRPEDPLRIPPRFRPGPARLPLTQVCPYDAVLPAAEALAYSADKSEPAIVLKSLDADGEIATWGARRDLLNSDGAATEFVVETEDDSSARIRFGDDKHGRRPEAGAVFRAERYRTGNGRLGNIGAEALSHIVTAEPAVTGVRNPLPASGGVDPETKEEVRERAPWAFRTQERAVTESDYGAMAERDAAVQRAAATFRWTGSWHTVFVTVDPLGGPIPGAEERREFLGRILAGLERYRMAGHDLAAGAPRYVSLEIVMHVCVKPGYFRSQVREALREVFGAGLSPEGRRGVFHPDHFTFGQAVYLSPLYAAAQAVEGVASVHVTTFQRQGEPDLKGLQTGKLELSRLEIARCDNDPSFPEHGSFQLNLGGGK